MRNHIVIVFLLLLLLNVGVSTHSALADGEPQVLASFHGITLPQYAWVSDSELFVWSDSENSATFSRYDISTKTPTEIKRWTRIGEPLSGTIVFSKQLSGYGAWLESMPIGLTSRVISADTTQIRVVMPRREKSIDFKLGDSGQWHDPVWCRVGRYDMVVVIGADAGGPVEVIYSLSPELPFRVERPGHNSVLASLLNGLFKMLGSNSQGKVVATSQSLTDEKCMIVTLDPSSPSMPIKTYPINIPAAYIEDDAALCGDTVVWMLRKRSTDSVLTKGSENIIFELWTSKTDGSHLKRLAQITGRSSDERVVEWLNSPCALRAKPDGSAVTYLRGSDLYLVPVH